MSLANRHLSGLIFPLSHKAGLNRMDLCLYLAGECNAINRFFISCLFCGVIGEWPSVGVLLLILAGFGQISEHHRVGTIFWR